VIVDRRTRAGLAATTRFSDIREFESLDSTNRYLLDEARGGAVEGVVAVADYQTAGRGRLGRTWTAPAGSALLVSVLLRPAGLALERRHLVTVAVALAAAAVVEQETGVAPGLKWPNDLLVDDRKLAGILAEAEGDAVVAGMGLNVTSAPPGAVSLAEVTAGSARAVPERGALLTGLLEALEGWYGRWDDVAAAYRDRCATVGRSVRAELPGRTVVGRAEGIDERGHLLIRAEGGELVEVLAGDVIHVRPS
jgi:BirA family transcriptional regulator, biotin operon repressor / biotin---[acetyl-CoA-carboxylase] ligase